MKKIITLKSSDIKSLVTKIIAENETNQESDEWSWIVPDLARGEKIYKQKWRKLERGYRSLDLDDIFDKLMEHGITELSSLDDVVDELEDIISNIYDEGREDGYGNCDCDGCCDDYIWYEDHREQLRDAKQEARQEGRDERDDEVYELESEIEELKEKIEALEDIESEKEELEDKVQELEEIITELKSKLGESNE